MGQEWSVTKWAVFQGLTKGFQISDFPATSYLEEKKIALVVYNKDKQFFSSNPFCGEHKSWISSENLNYYHLFSFPTFSESDDACISLYKKFNAQRDPPAHAASCGVWLSESISSFLHTCYLPGTVLSALHMILTANDGCGH